MYREKIYSSYMTSGYGALNSKRDLERSYSAFDYNYSKFLKSDFEINVLEIGCGMGHFQDYLHRKGYMNKTAIDIGPEQIEYCEANYKGNFVLVDNTNCYLAENCEKYDVIVMNDVLEHFTKHEAIEILEHIRKALKPTGRLIMRTPNMAALFAGASRYGDFTHETGFTERSACQLLKTVGFSTVQCLPEKNFIKSPLKKCVFDFLSLFRLFILKSMVFLERPGDLYPTIFSKNLIIVADH